MNNLRIITSLKKNLIKSIFQRIITFLYLISPLALYSQITISEIETVEEKIVAKPLQYDSLKNWESKERLSEYKQYIGLKVYLPPFHNPEIGTSNKIEPFLYTYHPTLKPIDTSITKLKIINNYSKFINNRTGYASMYFTQEPKYIYTYVYKPYHYFSISKPHGNITGCVYISNDSSVGNRYYTIVNVVYMNELTSLLKYFEGAFNDKKTEMNDILKKYHDTVSVDTYSQIAVVPWNIILDEDDMLFSDNSPEFLFLIRDDITGDSIYCTEMDRFILVPYFVKQKEMFKNKKLEFDASITDYENRIEYDTRFVIKYEDENGEEISTGKEVLVNDGSIWTCIDVTLLKPTFEINYILSNDKDEQIALTDLNGFILKSVNLNNEADNKLQYQQLLAQQKQEEIRNEKFAKIELEKRRKEFIPMFGQQNGELIAQRKVKINMSKEMCTFAWGQPLWTSRATTEKGTYEIWYYWSGYSLHFMNGLLKIITE